MIYNVGSKDFILQDLDTNSPIGDYGKIKDGNSKLNVLMIKNMGCGHCVRYLPEYMELSSGYSNVNFLVLETSDPLNSKLMDQWSNLASPAYTIQGVPTVVLYDADGKFIKEVDRRHLPEEIKKYM